MKNKKIGVLMGGLSKEREISLKSGRAVATALRAKGYEVVEIDVGRHVAEDLKREKVEVAFVALHGRYGEDGAIQGLLEILEIPYTGTGILGSAIGLDKNLTKKLVVEEGIRTPDWKLIHQNDVVSASGGRPPLPLPLIVKPNCEGSTIGMTIVKEGKDLAPALKLAGSYDEWILVEQYVSGIEVTVGAIDGKVLPVLEIVPQSGFYDFAAKYTKGMTEYIVPARISEKVRAEVTEVSKKIFSRLGLSGCARMDFIVPPQGEAFFLEVNTIPGFTETSLVPKMAAAAGVSFEDLCEQVLEGASLKIRG